MSDLISRQAAIEALLEKGQSSRRYKVGEIWELNFDEIREALATVPSAEPELYGYKGRIMTEEEYKLMWRLIGQAIEEGHGWESDYDEVISLIPDWETIVHYREEEEEKEEK